MSTPSSAPAPSVAKWSAPVLTGLFLVIAVVLFSLVYVILPGSMHFYGLLWIGILALIISLVCYLAESLARDPSYQRSLAWGFFGLGFAVLYLTIGLAPSYGVTIGSAWQLTGLLVTTIVLAIAVVGVTWRMRSVAAVQPRAAAREEWRERPAPSAFSYAAANSPAVPATAAPPPPPPSGSSPPRGP
jgi:hypothetical protein